MCPVLRAHIDICQELTAGMAPQNLFVCGSAVLEVLAASLTGPCPVACVFYAAGTHLIL